MKFPFITSNTLFKLLTDEVIEDIETQPYILTKNNSQKDALLTADKIAKFQQLDKNCEERLVAYCKHIMKNLIYTEKHFWFSHTYVAEEICASLKCNEWPVEITSQEARQIVNIVCVKDPIDGSDDVSLEEFSNQEKQIAFRICNMLKNDTKHILNLDDEVDNDLDCEQKNAVYMSLRSSLIITGKAGTGKTKVIKEIVRVMNISKLPVKLCAPHRKSCSSYVGRCWYESNNNSLCH